MNTLFLLSLLDGILSLCALKSYNYINSKKMKGIKRPLLG